MQNGFVVRDWRVAAEHWSTVLGVGPFFVMEHIAFEHCEYRGQPATIDMSVAIAYSGEQQIELVQQHNDAPSIYRDFLERSGEGLQHVGALTDNLAAALQAQHLADKVMQSGVTRLGQRFAYVDTVQHNGTMLELIEVNDQMRSAFAYMKNAAAQWNGERAIRISK
jgi:4-hydroxyphenylpyruvate dioxygenase-like putative hemolysin